MEIEFKTLKFEEQDESVIGRLYDFIEIKIPKDELLNIFDGLQIVNGKIIYKSLKKPLISFYSLLKEKLLNNSYNLLTKRKISYIDFDTLYLLGTQYFGFLDRGTNVVEVRPITGCINKCIFCSVSEGPGMDYWVKDFIVSSEYMLSEARKIKRLKGEVEWLINPQGEALLYPELESLIRGLKSIGEKVGLITSLWPLDNKREKIIYNILDDLDYLSISIHSLDAKKSKILFGNPEYDINKVLEFIESISDKIDITLTPVIMGRYNVEDLEEIVKFAKGKLKNKERPLVLPQKYLIYPHGRKVSYEDLNWEEFYNMLKRLEKKYGIKLTGFKMKDLGMKYTKEIPSPFRRGQIIKVKPVTEGRRKNEILAIAKERTISVYTNNKEIDKVRITYAKHNVFIAEPL